METPTDGLHKSGIISSEREILSPLVVSPQQRSSRAVRYTLYGICLLGAAFAGSQIFSPVLQNQSNEATIVFSAPLSLETTKIAQNSITLALEERGYKAGDVALKLVVMDGGDETGNWVAENELANATKAVEDPSVMAYIGPRNSGAAKVSMPVLNKAGIVQVSMTNTWPGLTKIGFYPGEPGAFYPTGVRHYFRVCTTDDRQGPAGAAWADELGLRKVFIVNDRDAYGIGIAQLFENDARKRGMEVVGTGSISSESSTYQALARTAVESGADLVYYGGITPNGAPEFLAEIRSLGSSAAFMGPDGIFDQEFLSRAGAAAEGTYVTAVGAPPEEVASPGARSFVSAYRARFKSEPDVFGALAYDAAVLLIEAIGRADSINRASVLSEVRSIESHNGVFGVFGFDENGDTTQTLMSGNRVINGAFTFSKVLESE